MLEFIRTHTKLLGFLLALLVIPGFVLFGVSNYTSYRERHQEVASVGGQTITQTMWDQAHQSQVNQMRQQFAGVDLRQIDNPQTRYLTLLRLVEQQLLLQVIDEGHLWASDQEVAQLLLSWPEIAALKNSKGQLDTVAYARLLKQQGLTPEAFEEAIRQDLSLQRLKKSMMQNVWLPASLQAQSNQAYQAFLVAKKIPSQQGDVLSGAQLESIMAQTQWQAYLNYLHQRYQVKIHVPLPSSVQ